MPGKFENFHSLHYIEKQYGLIFGMLHDIILNVFDFPLNKYPISIYSFLDIYKYISSLIYSILQICAIDIILIESDMPKCHL